MQTNKSSLTLSLLLVVALIIPSAVPQKADAQSACTNQIAGKSRAQLEAELEACNKEIEQWTNTLNATKQESASFARDVSALTAKINAAQSNIKAKNIAISNLSKDIQQKEQTITVLDRKIEIGRKAMADILRRTNDINSYSIVEALLSNKDMSEFFVDIDTYASAQSALTDLFADLRNTKALTQAEREELNRKKEAEANAKAAIEKSKKEVEVANNEKKTLLAVSQSKEKTYEQVVADRKAKASQIREALFPLRDAGPIQFGQALQYAEAASAKTGVRPALILGILQQESNLGANVGSCVIADLSSGTLKGVNTGRLFPNGIHPTRDLPLLQTVVTKLGRDPLQTKVSCPLSIGYGGAMGPAQFIPSTWKIIEPSLASAVGKATPDPWNPSDAIMASAILLRDLGASAGTYEAERNAACRYYSGRSCSSLSHASAYGNQVMAKAGNIQLTMIDPLKGL